MSYELHTRFANRKNYGLTRSLPSIRYIVIHYTGNDGDTADANGTYFQRNVVKTSAHYFVDNNTVIQSVPDNHSAYHCGAKKYYHPLCRNKNSIGVEMCDTCKDGRNNVSAQTLENTAALVQSLMSRYNIPVENVVRHYDVTHKLCPIYFVSDEASWQNFKNMLTGKPDTASTVTLSGNDIIRKGQIHANNFVGAGLETDGKHGPLTKKAGIKVLQYAMNLDYGNTLTIDGCFGTKSKKKLGTHYVKYGERQYMVTAAQILLMLKGYDPNGVELPGQFGPGMKKAVLKYQADHNIATTGIVNALTFQSLIS